MRFSNQRTVRALALLGWLCVLGGARTAHAQLVAPFSDRIDVDQQYVMGATAATDIAFAADGRAVVTTKSGDIWIRQTSGTPIRRMGVFSGVSMSAEQGLLGVVADPTVANTFYFYVSNGSGADDRHRVMKALLNADNTFTVDATPVVAASRMLGPGLAGPANHNGGALSIYQNRLYVGVGDTGANATPPTNKFSSCLNRPNGKILRVALDGTIPTDNPLVNVAMATACDSTGGAWTNAAPDRRIFAWGFRNPWRVWVDPMSGLMWVGDVGETTREEVSVGPSGHFGYPFREGTTNYEGSNGRGADGSLQNMHCMTMSPSRTCTGPVHDWARVNGAAAVGGLIPDGCGWNTALGGTMYLFSDYGPGFLRGLTVSNRMMGTASSTATNLGTFNNGPVAFRMGPDESLYIVMNRGNSVVRLTPRDRTGCMGGMGGAGGGGPGGAGAGGNAGSGTMGGAGGLVAGAAGVGMDMGGQAGSVGPGGTGTGGATAGAGAAVTGGTAGVPATGGAAPGGGMGPMGGAPVGGAPGGGSGPTGSDPEGTDEPAGCGCRAARGSGFGYLALALGLVLTLGARLRRGRRRGD